MSEYGEKLDRVLRELGLNVYESKAYLALLGCGESTAPQISKKSNIPKAKIYEVLESLKQKGFLLCLDSKPRLFLPQPLKKAMENVKNKIIREHKLRIEDIERMETGLGDISMEKTCGIHEGIWTLTDPDHIETEIGHMLCNASRTMYFYLPHEEVVPFAKKHINPIKKIKKGVDLRFLAPVDQENYREVLLLREYGLVRHSKYVMKTEGKTFPSPHFILQDTDTCLFFLDPHKKRTALIRSEYVIAFMNQVFELEWKHSTPLDARLKELNLRIFGSGLF